jgi:CubicO group peptidase (beta-lactamase class C family)
VIYSCYQNNFLKKNKMKKTNLFIALALCLFFTACCNKTENLHKKADAAIDSVLENYEYVGLAIMVVRDNQIVYSNQFGVRNIETQEKISPDDLFRIASISKTFTATAIMQLYEQGKFDLDDDISDALGYAVRNPRFPNEKITYRMLLSHTSSLSDAEGYFNFDILNPELNSNYANVFWDFAPGEEYRYCNLNFNLLGALVELHSGERFDNYIRQNLLLPLGMTGSGFNVDSLDNSKFVSLYMRRDGDWIEGDAYASPSHRMENYVLGQTTVVFSPTGGLKTSSSELTKWMLCRMNFGTLDGVTIISEESARLMQTPVELKGGGTSSYGFGIGRATGFIEGETLFGHNGNAYGLLSGMFFEPDKKFGIVLLTSGSAPKEEGENTIIKDIISAVLQVFIKENE